MCADDLRGTLTQIADILTHLHLSRMGNKQSRWMEGRYIPSSQGPVEDDAAWLQAFLTK